MVPEELAMRLGRRERVEKNDLMGAMMFWIVILRWFLRELRTEVVGAEMGCKSEEMHLRIN